MFVTESLEDTCSKVSNHSGYTVKKHTHLHTKPVSVCVSPHMWKTWETTRLQTFRNTYIISSDKFRKNYHKLCSKLSQLLLPERNV